MAIQKHLHELLKEDQEPFHLKNYIADRRCQFKRPNSHKSTSLQVKKRNPIVENSLISTSKPNLCKHACFLSFQASPDVRKSPLSSFLSPARSPCRTQNGNGPVFLHIPARTAALLLEAALKIQKQQSSSHSKPKTQIKNLGLGLFSSILKKLKDRKRSRKSEVGFGECKSSRNSEVKGEEILDARRINDVAFFGSCNNGRLSSAGWSESNEDMRSLDMESSTSSFSSEISKELDFVIQYTENGPSNCSEKSFCFSPYSPFRFSLQRSPSSGVCTPIFSSPAASPTPRKGQKKNFNENSSDKFGIEEEDEKEQSSPVSVLDPPFENEDHEHESLDDEEDYDVECSFAIVQRTKEQLLYKLCRFEKLAELDPIELEKRMLDEEENEEAKDVCELDESAPTTHGRCGIDSYVKEVLSKTDVFRQRKAPGGMERLVSDLISEEEKSNMWLENGKVLVESICSKLECWKEVESDTIDMMAEMDLRNELNQWKRCQDQNEETGMEIELAIFAVLLEEVTDELESSK